MVTMTRRWSLIVCKRFNVVNVVIGNVSLWWSKGRWKGEKDEPRESWQRMETKGKEGKTRFCADFFQSLGLSFARWSCASTCSNFSLHSLSSLYPSLRFSLPFLYLSSLSFWRNEGRATGKERQFFPSRTWTIRNDTFVKQLPALCLPTVGFLSCSNFSVIWFSLILSHFFLLEISCRNFLSLKNLLKRFSSNSSPFFDHHKNHLTHPSTFVCHCRSITINHHEKITIIHKHHP